MSGALSAAESATLLDALRNSALYRADQNSYILYPDRKLPGFFEKNNIPSAGIGNSKLLSMMIARNDGRIVRRDLNGVAHFNAAFRNATALKEALASVAGSGEYGELADVEGPQILALYEQVFDHRSFTGRSGTFYKYEGLGCIYWHMVSKLLLAVQDVLQSALEADESPEVIERLKCRYREIREGIGAHKRPEVYGAIPLDPYSHTPGFAGVQQPGMTGQVKEDLITRLGEMGVIVKGGKLSFLPKMAPGSEFLLSPGAFRYYDLEGQERTIDLTPGTLAFTICQIPVVAHAGGPKRIEVADADGVTRRFEGLELDANTSAAVFERNGAIKQLDVFFGLSEDLTNR